MAQHWRLGVTLVSAYILAVLLVFQHTALSMWDTWGRMQTYNHGYLIVPITLWLIWDRRKVLEPLFPAVSLLAFPFLIGAGGLWYLGALTDALVVQQFALVLMVALGVWSILGQRVALAMLFPLSFLLFAVPVGDDLVPPLMEFTATFTVELLRITGIPVYREGLYFSLPTGNWSVVQACSGIRYLIASVTLGSLYAYLTYRKVWKRAAFVLASILVPILANGLRAYSIVMIGHLSGMEYATGVDHLIWGWAFFGIVMFVLFSIGAIWRDGDVAVSGPALADNQGPPSKHASTRLVAGAMFAIVIVTFWHLMAGWVEGKPTPSYEPGIDLPHSIDGWRQTDKRPWKWSPTEGGADRSVLQAYENGGDTVLVVLQQYFNQEQGEELVKTGQFLVGGDADRWRIVGRSGERLDLAKSSLTVTRTILEGADNRRLVVLSWYRVNHQHTSHPYLVKALEALSYAGFQPPISSRLYLAFEEGVEADSNAPGQQFLDDALKAIEEALDKQQ